MVTFFPFILPFLLSATAYEYANSDLTSLGSSRSTFDLVTALTQRSVNHISKPFVSKQEKIDPLGYVYQYNDDAGPNDPMYTLVPYDEAETLLGFDPFGIPDGTDMSDPRVEAIADNNYLVGIKAQFGKPPVEDSRIPEPIKFDDGAFSVTYNMILSQFQTFELTYAPGKGEHVRAVSQTDYLSESPDNTPFDFIYSVKLSVVAERAATQITTIPLKLRLMVEKNGRHFYSISKANIPISTATLETMPDIPGIPSTSQVFALLRTFLPKCIAKVDPDAEGIPLGLFGIADRYPQLETAVVPTGLEFRVSPHLTDNGYASGYHDAYMLNFYMSTEENTQALPVDPTWNWIGVNEEKNFDGVMAVRRDVFVGYLRDILSPELDKVCFDPRTTLVAGDSNVDVTWVLEACRNVPMYDVVQNPDTEKVMTYEHLQTSVAEDGNVPPISRTYLTTRTTSEVFLEHNRIRAATLLKISGFLKEGDSECGPMEILKETITATYFIDVDVNGRIRATLEGGEPKIVGRRFSGLSKWKRANSENDWNELLQNIKASIGQLVTLMKLHAEDIEKRLNSIGSFAFPAEESMKFVNIAFSKYSDVVAHIKIESQESSPEVAKTATEEVKCEPVDITRVPKECLQKAKE